MEIGRLRVSPIYGWGWFLADSSNRAIDVPPLFELTAEIIDGPHLNAIGRLDQPSHSLHGMWIWLCQRTGLGDCNVCVYRARPKSGDDSSLIMTGFADVAHLGN